MTSVRRPPRRYEYVDSGPAIYVDSFATIRREADLRTVPADAEKCEEAEFIMLKDGQVHFEGHAGELRNSKDPYIRAFLS